jgi:hypothetical protein
MVRPTYTRRLNMNAHATTGIRELTAQELDQVTGGYINSQETEAWVFSITVAVGILTSVGAFLEWLFG